MQVDVAWMATGTLILNTIENQNTDDGAIIEARNVDEFRDATDCGGVTETMTHSLSAGRPCWVFMAWLNTSHLVIERPAGLRPAATARQPGLWALRVPAHRCDSEWP
jgi:hypothetical protein